jgi:uncharacterized protein (DUF608 family)
MKKSKVYCIILCILILSGCYNRTEKTADMTSNRSFNGTYTGKNLDRIAFPLGGLGAGMICLEGTGAFSHVSVRNTPEVFNEPLLFAAITVKGLENGAKVLEGPVPEWKCFGRPNTARGGERTSWGLPRFEQCDFTARFPFATIHLSDSDLPLNVTITGWSPFIPTDPDNSALPAGVIEYTLKNSSSKEIETLFSFHSVNFMRKGEGTHSINPISGGFVLHQDGSEKEPQNQGDFAIFTDQPDAIVDHCWFRGGWWDPLTMTWKYVEEFNPVQNPPVEAASPGASIYIPVKLASKEE